MEWTFTHATYVTMISLLCGLQIFVYLADAKKLANYSIPGEQCDSGFIIETGNQYSVHFADKVNVGGKTVPRYLSGPIDCTLKFRAHKNERFLIRIVHFQLQFSDLCRNDSLTLLDGLQDDSKSLTKSGKPLCGDTLSLPNYFTSSGNGVTVRFFSDGGERTDGLKMYLTPFTTDGDCAAHGKFLCTAHKKCITSDAYCNSVNQCEDGSDEPGVEVCSAAGNLNSRFTGGGLLVASALLMMFFSG